MAKFTGKSKSKASAFARAAAASVPSEPKGDQFDFGKFRVRLKDCQESEGGSFGITFVGAGDDEEIGERIQWFSVAGKAAHVSGPRIKSLCMALLGLGRDEVEEYNEFDPGGEFLDTILNFELGAAAEYMAAKGIAKSAKAARAVLDEAEVMIVVTKGGEKDDGDYFRNASFAPVSDDGADAEDEDEDEDEDDAPDSEVAPKAKRKAKAAPVAAKGKRKAAPEPDDDDTDEEDADDEDEDEDEDEDDAPPPPKRKAKVKASRR